MVEEVADIVKEDTLSWDDHVKQHVTKLLDAFLPISNDGGIEVKYVYAVKERYEGHVEYDLDKADGVKITLMLEFENTKNLVK